MIPSICLFYSFKVGSHLPQGVTSGSAGREHALLNGLVRSLASTTCVTMQCEEHGPVFCFSVLRLHPARICMSACKTRVSDVIDSRPDRITDPHPNTISRAAVMSSVTAAAPPCMDSPAGLRTIWTAAAAIFAVAAASAAEHGPRSCTTSSDCVWFAMAGEQPGGRSWRCEMGICVPIPLVTKRNRHGVRNS